MLIYEEIPLHVYRIMQNYSINIQIYADTQYYMKKWYFTKVGNNLPLLLDMVDAISLGRLKWYPKSPFSLSLVAWVAYRDWVINQPSPVADALLHIFAWDTVFIVFVVFLPWGSIFLWLAATML